MEKDTANIFKATLVGLATEARQLAGIGGAFELEVQAPGKNFAEAMGLFASLLKGHAEKLQTVCEDAYEILGG